MAYAGVMEKADKDKSAAVTTDLLGKGFMDLGFEGSDLTYTLPLTNHVAGEMPSAVLTSVHGG